MTEKKSTPINHKQNLVKFDYIKKFTWQTYHKESQTTNKVEKRFAALTSLRTISLMYKELLQNKTKTSKEKWANDIRRQFTEYEIQIAFKCE